MTLSMSRDAIAFALEAVPGLTVYRVWPNTIAVPSLLIEAMAGLYAVTFNGGLEVTFGLILLVSALNGPGEWMDLLDDYLEPSGAMSIDGAVRAAGFGLVSFENPGKYDVNGKQYYGVHLTMGSVYQ